MRLTAIALLAFSLHVGARAVSQSITYSGKNVSLETVFDAIEKQTGFVVFYDYRQIAGAGPVTLEVKNEPLQAFLERCFNDQPFGFSIENKTIVIRHKMTLTQIPAEPAAPPPPPDLHGHVMDSLGNPLAGASVSIKGTKIVVATDQKGNFTLKGPVDEARVVVSYVGYVPREIEVNARNSAYVLAGIMLRHNDNPLDEVHVIAYGTESRRFSVGASAFVSSKDIEVQPVTNILQALEGQVAGLAVTPANGVPGSQNTLQIRGQNTLKNSTSGVSTIRPYDQPMILVDGVPFATQNNVINQINTSLVSGGTSLSGATTGFTALNNLNPADIESISVLKDADATSIYGTQGSNGVILITTKKGKAGKTVVGLSDAAGFDFVAKPIQLLNTQQYLQVRKDALQSDGITLTPANSASYPDLTVFDQNKYTDWYDQIVARTPFRNMLNLSVSGGTAKTSFYVSGGYRRTGYNFPGNFSDNAYSLHSALEHTTANNRLTIDLGSDISYDNNNSAFYAGTAQILLPPNLPNLLDSSGNLVWTYKGVNISQQQFYTYLKKTSVLENYNFNDNVRLTYKIVTGLSITATLGYNRNETLEQARIPASAQSPVYGPTSGEATFGNSVTQAVNIEPQLNYSRTIGKGALSVLVGGTYKKNEGHSTNQTGTGYTNDNLLNTINAAASVTSSDNASIYKYSGAFGSIGYIYDQKYILRFTGNRDGSSDFGPGRQFGNFGSAGLGWIFSEEHFFKKLLPVVSFAKFSTNYGTSGNDGGAYLYQPFWQPISNVSSFQGVRAYQPLNIYNPDYSWDLKKSLNLSLEIGLFKDRLMTEVSYYINREGNQLTSYPLPYISGFPSVLENIQASVQNTGWEFNVNSTNIKTKNFTWSTRFNMSFGPFNKLLSFPNLANSSFANIYVVGRPTTMTYVYRYKDVNPTTGLFEFYNAKGEATSTPINNTAAAGGDLVPFNYNLPKFSGGLGNTFSYKSFSLVLFFQFDKRTAPNWLAAAYNGLSAIPGGEGNMPAALLGHYWQNPGDIKPMERLTTTYGDAYNASSTFTQSTGAYSDDTYLRLTTAALSYSLPGRLLKGIGVSSAHFSLQGQNLLTFTDYKVGDPQQPGAYNILPLQRTVACNLSLTF